MGDEPITFEVTGEPNFRIIESKFTIESDSYVGGDWEKNIGGARNQKRVTFSGYITPDMYSAIINAIAKVVE